MKTTNRCAVGITIFLILSRFVAGTVFAQLAPPGSGGGGTSPVLNYWPFSDTNWLAGDGHSPLAFTNLVLSPTGDGYASLLLDSTNTAYLRYAVVESGGHTNLIVNGTNASLSFWFCPSWSSADQPDGVGVGGWARLFELGEFTTNASNGWFSIYLSPDGQNIFFSAEDTNGVATNYLYAPISWQAGAWHFLALTYSTITNCALYCDGVLLTNGDPLTILPGPAALTNGFAVGSDFAGAPEHQAHGSFDDLYTYDIVLDPVFIQDIYGLFALIDFGVTNFSSSASFTATLPTATNGFNAVTGPGSLQWVGADTNLSPGGQVYIANPTASVAADFSTTFIFSIGGGTNGAAYDVFGTAELVGNSATNSQWYWLGQGYTGNTYQLANQPGVSAYYVLGTPSDVDSDGLTDAYENLVSHTDPNNPDTSYSSLSDGWYVYYGLNALSPADVPDLRLGYWRFNTNSWVGEQGQVPIVATNLSSVTNWSGSAVLISNSSPAILRYPERQAYGFANLYLPNGSVRLWLQPGWASGTGPGSWASVIEMAQSGSELWSLRISPAGDALELVTQAGGVTTTNVQASLSGWTNGVWHQIVCTYNSSGTAIYLDGQLSATGSALLHYPGATTRANGFSVGSTASGSGQIKGAIDELETFNYPLSSNDIAGNYNAMYDSSAANILIDFVPDHVKTNVVTPTFSEPAGEMAILVDSTNFSSATWVPCDTNAAINLGSGDARHTVWFGLSGVDGAQYWQQHHVTVDTTPPLVVVTGPTNSTTSLPTIQVSGYSPEPLASLSYDVANTNGLVTNLPGSISYQYYDTNISDYTTNYFQLYDVDLAGGTNTITIHATDLAGNVTITNFPFTFDLTLDTNAPVMTLFWPTNGVQVSGSNLTVRGSIDNPTAQLSAAIVDTNGVTNTLAGLVERNGLIWVENLPLSPGTNTLTLTATDAAGNYSTTNLAVIQNPLQLTLDTVDPGSLNQPTVDLSGTISDTTDYAIWVNGIEAYQDGSGNWYASSVPLDDGGTACIQVRAIPNTDTTNGGGGSAFANPDSAHAVTLDTEQDKPAVIRIGTYNLNRETAYRPTFNWTETLTFLWDNFGSDSFDTLILNLSGTISGFTNDWPDPNNPTNSTPPIIQEQSDINAPIPTLMVNTNGGYSIGPSPWARAADVTFQLLTRGKVRSHQQHLFQLQGSATIITNVYWPPENQQSVPPGYPAAPSQMTLNGLTPDSYGNVYALYADNTTNNVSLHVAAGFSIKNVTQTKFTLVLSANGVTLDPDFVVTNATFCVGQDITLSADWSPPLTNGAKTKYGWVVDPNFINRTYPPLTRDGSESNGIDLTALTHNPSAVWWYDGGGKTVTCNTTNYFTNGRIITFTEHGLVSIYRPQMTQFVPAPPFIVMITNGYLELGDEISTLGIMQYNAVVQSTTNFPGQANWTQLVNRNTSPTPSTGGQYWLDNDLFYNTVDGKAGTPPVNTQINPKGTVFFKDNPGVSSGSSAHCTDAFQTYLVFRPDPQESSIWVTLGIVTWGWSGIESGSVIVSSNVVAPVYSNSYNFPAWPHTYRNK